MKNYNISPYIKLILVWIIILASITAFFLFVKPYLNNSRKIISPVNTDSLTNLQLNDVEYEGINPESESESLAFGDEEKALLDKKSPNNPDNKSKPFNILVLGIDRRYGDQKNWRTDVIQLITLSNDRKKAVVTHIPRDVWADTYKINAIYNLKGPEATKDIIEKITNQRPDRIIRVDFDAFVWAVDAVGGIDINVPTGFTDEGYPDDRNGNNEIITVSFEEGLNHMDGETALIYVRSRKGNNGEGSDYARGTRQQIVMQTVVKDYFKPKNMFNPKTAELLYKIATEKVYTDLSLADTKILFDLLLNYKDIEVKNLRLDTTNFLNSPQDRTPYGGAWVLTANDDDYSPVHNEISSFINAN